MSNKPIRIIVHHTGFSSEKPQLTLVNDYHKQKDFPKSSLGYFVGYTYLIEKDGTIIQTRTDTEEQAHTLKFNVGSIGICLSGNFNKEFPTVNQRHNLRELIVKKREEYGIPADMVKLHRNFRDTSCPGENLTNGEIKIMAEYLEFRKENLTQQLTLFQKVVGLLKRLLSKIG